ncbi:MAG: helix-turn-helix domain-containing protein [Egibacteraceae bacterium]
MPGAGGSTIEQRLLTLGVRLREARLAKSRTLTDVAEHAGVTASLVSQVERGVCNPSIASLIAIAGCLQVSIAELFVNLPPAGPVLRAAERVHESLLPGVHAAQLNVPSDRNCEVAEILMDPGGMSATRPSRHRGRETGFVVRGAAVVELDDARHELGPGDSVSFSSSAGHRIANASTDESLHLVWVSYIPPDER